MKNSIEPFWTVVGAPVIQEIIFRFIPYQYLVPYFGIDYLLAGIFTSVAYASIHWYFGKWFVLYTFFLGLLLWYIIGEFGIVAAIIVHSLANIIDLRVGWREMLRR